MEIGIYQGALNSYWITSLLYLFKIKQYKNVSIAKFVYYGKTRLDPLFLFMCYSSHELILEA